MTGSALIIIDMQVGMFEEAEAVYQGDMLLRRIAALITKARSSMVPVIYVQHNEDPGGALEPNTRGWEIHPAVAPMAGDIRIQKNTPDSFYNTSLHEELEKGGIRKLVLTGMQTELCVDTTCRRAFTMGYDVVLAKDSHSTFNKKNLSAQQIIEHHNDLLRWFAETKESERITF
ncbi:cysteine hydrolase family protein [Ferroacidibacillus organovorans]|uniref:Cysteine hydrolase n=1 Tax=Ferroacidibacillus organovorans TaxID=1765683 RepID=A0A1V4ERB8_9BACL|nr:cysteine hydrolase family protein [Ferroacidibacillus organovorans]OPG15479.1 cysteine hydrolase [Ferroacidibacillus organovorans]